MIFVIAFFEQLNFYIFQYDHKQIPIYDREIISAIGYMSIRLLILSIALFVASPESDYSNVKLFCKDLPVEQVKCGGDDLDKQFSRSTEVIIYLSIDWIRN